MEIEQSCDAFAALKMACSSCPMNSDSERSVDLPRLGKAACTSTSSILTKSSLDRAHRELDITVKALHDGAVTFLLLRLF